MKQKLLTSAVLLMSLMMIFTIYAPQNTLAASQSLNNMLEIRSDDGVYDANEASAMTNRLNRVDERILYHTSLAGVKIILTDMPLTELPEFQYLSGVTPNGWEGTGSTWDDVPGAGGYTTAARIGYSNPGNGHSTINLELHEYGHAVDDFAAGTTLSETQEFLNIMSQEKNSLFHDHEVPSYFDAPGEYFAEAFAMYYLGGNANAKLANRAPQTYQFMHTLHNRLISIQGATGNTTQFAWDANSNAAYYEVYRNNQLIDTTTKTSYKDTGLETSTSYNYYIRAMGANDNPLYASYYRTATTGNQADAPEVDRTGLEQMVAEAKKVPLEKRSPALQAALENAEELLQTENVKQAQLDETEQSLKSSISDNEDVQVSKDSNQESSSKDKEKKDSNKKEDKTSDSKDESSGEKEKSNSEEAAGNTSSEEPEDGSSEEATASNKDGSSEESFEAVGEEAENESSEESASTTEQSSEESSGDAEETSSEEAGGDTSSGEAEEDTAEAEAASEETGEDSKEETAEDETEEESAESVDTDKESAQASDGDSSNVVLIFGSILLFILGLVAAIVLWMRRN
ncbi:hypothetical protein GCM10022378_21910 [Salinicoccus jeotgali]|uniref:ATLF-like domain-containing protein n=1 Tax=Salinicoccus jeotgali TaxID=381634 RepID=A0ABP7F7Y4_9STAP